MEIELVSRGKHTLHGLNFYLSYFDDIAKVLPREDYCFIVGGWVRDRILGEPVGHNIDVDFLVTCDPVKIAQDFAERTGGHFFVFEKKGLLIKRPVVASVVIHLPPYRYRFDFSQVKGKDLEKALVEDLKERDFTANAIAVNLDDVLSIGAKQTVVFDPTGGIKDMEQGLLRPISEENLRRDPVRILRGFRLSVEKELKLTEDFYRFVEVNRRLVTKAPAERITHELFKVMKHPRASKVVRKLYEVGLLEEVFPEFAKLRNIKDQGEHHIYPLDEHTLKILEEVEKVIEERTKYLSVELLGDFGCRRFLGEFTDVELLKWGALLHDIGKPDTYAIKDGKVTFYNHDKVGEEIVKRIGKRLKWGEPATRFIGKLVRYHLRPFYLRESFLRGELKRKGMANFWKECGDIAPHLFLLSIADAFASGDTEEEVKALLETISELESFKRNELTEERVKPLLNGHEIMAILNITQGKMVGEIKRRLEEAQMEGSMRTREEAVEFVKKAYEDILTAGGEHA
ncbi:HDIG domain-containing metalloprotein [Hydrogenivirga sp. 128-5-R1-1]|uniref:HDIG domain-containing metalloprotein n=1 Tax=Hydrogenivirga sp. 128-5-R1-1 TaxID=392423 RepID=UPI00015EF77D|nr:HDIG domain-containing metalloprotein [Hydrogenivirga sp. 128-5-R1-1]EDP74929.1 poly A polymerase [Hydrogenivirga sp. 128-5-R1-1]